MGDIPDKTGASTAKQKGATDKGFTLQTPTISLPKGGGAIKNIDEHFQVNAANGTSSFSLTLPASKSRSDFGPALSLSYNSGSGNGCFGLGWSCQGTSIQRRTGKQIPEYRDADESDIFQFSGLEDLVPALKSDGAGNWTADEVTAPGGYFVKRYRPRIEGSFDRIERITAPDSPTFFWKVTTTANVVTIFGRNRAAQICDPADPLRIFRWLPEFSFDDKGNCMEFTYAAENLLAVASQLHEQNRLNQKAIFSNAYLQTIQYGNYIPYYPEADTAYNPMPVSGSQYLFSIVFDFGDHDVLNPIPAAQNVWAARSDAFSDYRAGFEIRTYRICERILFFNNFKELNDGKIPAPVLVRSLELQYRFFNNPLASLEEKQNAETDYIIAIQQTGYKKSGSAYSKKSLPPITFTYQEPAWNTGVHDLETSELLNAPVGIGDNYQWLDLRSEGISGILTEQGNSWYYKSNFGNGRFSAAECIVPKPSFTGLSGGRLQLQDLEADGRKFIVGLNESISGYFELTDEEEWLPFQSFTNLANVNLEDENLKWIDLNGDGRPDAIISKENVFTWFANAGKNGFKAPESSPKPYDEEQGPALVFRDPVQSIFLADMCGDGLTDIVRIRNGEVCYWPNVGYGKFGAKINMTNAPFFDNTDSFNPSFIYLADINGTGASDILYLGKNTFRAWINLSGNAWSDIIPILDFPNTGPQDKISVVDFLGNGTACIVWSSPLPNNNGAPMRYIDLLTGKKPFILSSYSNNLGKQVSCVYTSSSSFYIQDKLAGNPWVTKLPFPVQCVSQLMMNDLASGLFFTSLYTYHHGYYDHAEKEFRGFGRVEQTDTEDFSNFILSGSNNVIPDELQQAPVKTISWYHTGAYFNLLPALNQFENEYNTGPSEFDLPLPLLPAGLTPGECREAFRSCKGMMLRQEIYALDGTPLQESPYSVGKNTWQMRLLQPSNKNQYAVFFTFKSESAQFNDERIPDDPRISHNLNLEVDEVGHIKQSAAVVYGRQLTDLNLPAAIQAAQARINIIYNQNAYTNSFDTATTYRLSLAAASKSFDLTGLSPSNGKAFLAAELLSGFSTSAPIDFQDEADNINPQKRMIANTVTLYLNADLVHALPLNQVDELAFVYQQYQMAFSPSLLTDLLGTRVAVSDVINANYSQLDGINWWISSGRNLYLGGAETSTDAANRFYMPVAAKDASGSETQLTYDSYFLLLTSSQDALLNKSTVTNMDYRVLQPVQIQDINQNISEVLFDELGMVIATSIYGKESDGSHGDKPLAIYNVLDPANIDEVISDPQKFLQQATSFFYYDLNAWINGTAPACFASVTRETHVSELAMNTLTRTFISIGYTGGMGLALQSKTQADPGPALLWSGSGLTTVDTTPNLRWIGSGRTIYNNKGNPVKKYEPYFSTTYEFETEPALVEIGFSSILYYDPLGRNIRTVHPNGTYTKVEFDSWKQLSYDENDTVLDSPWYIALGSPNPALPEPSDPEIRAAWLAAKHAGTPAEMHLDPLGRTIYTVANNGADGNYSTIQNLDIQGNLISIIDNRNNTVLQTDYDMISRLVHQYSMDKGDSWHFQDVMKQTVFDFTSNTDAAGNSTDYIFEHDYDLLHRPTEFWMTAATTAASDKILIGINIYGENQPADSIHNLRGKVFQQYDQSGLVEISEYDFKGNIKNNFRQLAIAYHNVFDWNITNKATLLNTESFSNNSSFNATNQPTSFTSPDGSLISRSYNNSNLLNQVNVFSNGQNVMLSMVQSIDYNAKGQRTGIVYGNNSSSSYTYEETTDRLVRILSTRNKGADTIQDLNYTMDPVGNITQVADHAQQTVFFNNSSVDPSSRFQYDAIYRLVHAWGREHAGQNKAADQFDYDKTRDGGGNQLVMPGDMTAMQNYEEIYQYDTVGNMMRMTHNAGAGVFTNRWTKTFTTNSSNNQLLKLQVNGSGTAYQYDEHGNMLNLQPGSFNLNWNYADQLANMDLGGGGNAYYVYDNSGQRISKIIETGNLTKQRIYLGGYEVYREMQGGEITLERQTLHVMDDKQRIALLEKRTRGSDRGLPFLIRFQYNNQLGTACLELEGNPDPGHTTFIPKIISYEEFYPYGSSAYQAMDSQTETAKRYRYTGKERDDESGLYYFGARYYVAWLARWSATDPTGIADGPNVYIFVSGNPVSKKDENGTDGKNTTPPDNQPHPDPKPVAQAEALPASKDTTTVTVIGPDGKVVSTSTTANQTQGPDAGGSPASGSSSGDSSAVKPPIFLATSYGQPWQALDPKLWVLEFNLNAGGIKSLTDSGTSGGLNSWYGSARRGFKLGDAEGDVGGFGSINATASTGGKQFR